MDLNHLLAAINLKSADAISIASLCLDSRLIKPGGLFLAVPGHSSDGRSYINEAVSRGAVAVLYDPHEFELSRQPVPVVPVVDLARKVSLLAGCFYAWPGKQLQIVGVTGTNGKTTVTHLLSQAHALLGVRSGVVGTMGVGSVDALIDSGMTTPDPITVQAALSGLLASGYTHVNMEMSSHALDQQRVQHVSTEIAVFTQLSSDHLDYHGDLEQYAAAKERIFQLPGLQSAVINQDDPLGREWSIRYQDRLSILGFSLEPKDTHKTTLPLVCLEEEALLEGGLGYRLQVSTPQGLGVFDLPLLGRFNISNALAVVATLLQQGTDWSAIQRILPKLKPVLGRMQLFSAPSGAKVILDFAHTPDALEQVLQTLRTHCEGHLLCVFGCGGDRDISKRSVMGAIAARYADAIWITNDNPRTEDPQGIANTIYAGCGAHPDTTIQLDRGAAIEAAYHRLSAGDYLLVAGKGHESVQIIGTETHHWSDASCIARLCESTHSSEGMT